MLNELLELKTIEQLSDSLLLDLQLLRAGKINIKIAQTANSIANTKIKMINKEMEYAKMCGMIAHIPFINTDLRPHTQLTKIKRNRVTLKGKKK